MRVRKDALLALVLTGGLIATACSQSESEEADAGTITVAGMSANDHGTKDVSGESELDLELDDFYFEPTLLTGTAGQTVTIELENEGDAKHNFSLPDQAVDQDVESGRKRRSR
jgi:uncharacterized cupredoxin-like copper-binding protein